MTITVEQLEPRLALHGTLFEAQLTGSRDDALHCLLDGCPLIPAAPLPHQDNLEMQAEHLYLFSLFPVSAADGVNRIVVPAGETLVIDECLTAEWIRVQGTLDIREGAEIRVDTIVTDPASHFEVTGGTVTFIDGALRSDDPLQISRGLIAHGAVTIHGSLKTPFAEATVALAGDDSLVVSADGFFGWDVGDQLVIPGTSLARNEDDERTIAAIDGNTITLDRPLDFEHPELLGHKPVIANLTRSVVFQSENATGTRGHVMFMHTPRVSVEYAAFNDLGRTLADRVVTDPKIDGTGGDNPRGRYSLHAHRTGTNGDPIAITGVVVTDAKKLGIVNHSSHVIVDKSIAYKFDGSGFFTETGNELGEFRNNLAIRTTNTVGTFAQEENGRRNSDFGFSGNGFWLQGGGVQMHGNAAYGVNNGVAVFQGFPLIENGSEVTLHRDSLPVPDPTAPERIHPGHFPFTITNQLVVGAAVGIGAHNKGARGIPYGRWSLVEDVDLIHVTVGIGLNYTTGINLNRIRAVGNVDAPAGRAFAGNFSELAVYYRDISAEGFMVGITAPWTGGFATDPYDLSVQGATLRCTVGVYLPPNPFGRVYRFEDVTFLPLDPSVLAGTDIYGFPPSLPAGEQFDFYYA